MKSPAICRVAPLVALIGLVSVLFARATPPTIKGQTGNATVWVGQSTNFAVQCIGTPPLQFQWMKEGRPISGATTNKLVFNTLGFMDAGHYTVVITNSEGVAQGSNEVLTVICPPGGATDLSISNNVGYVQAVAPDAAGGFYILGQGPSLVQHFNADLTRDPNYMTNRIDSGSSAYAIALQNDGKVVIGGYFRLVNGLPYTNIARLDTNGLVDTNFQARIYGNTGTGYVRALAVQTNSQIIMGGAFTNVDGVACNNLVRLNQDGTLDSSFQPGITGAIESIALQNDGRILVSGGFSNVTPSGGQTNLVRLNSDGSVDSSFNVSIDSEVLTYIFEDSGQMLLGGTFTNINGVARTHVARLNADGTLAADVFNGGGGVDGYRMDTVLKQPDGKLILGGYFSHVNGLARPGIARLNADGSVDDTFANGIIGNPGENFSGGRLVGMFLRPGGKLLVLGGFFSFNGLPNAGLVQLWLNQPPCIEATAAQVDGSISMTLRGTPGFTNRVQFKNSLSDAAWTDLIDVVGTDPSSTTNITDSPSGMRFYQVKEVQ